MMLKEHVLYELKPLFLLENSLLVYSNILANRELSPRTCAEFILIQHTLNKKSQNKFGKDHN